MRHLTIAVLALILSSTVGRADRYDDCFQYQDSARQLRGCTLIIELGDKETRKLRAKAHYNRASHYYVKGDWEIAIIDYTKSIAMNPNNPFSYGRRGEAYLNRGRFERAIADFSKAIKMQPNYFMAYYHRGFAHRNIGDRNRAEADFEEFMRRVPKNSPGYFVGRGNVAAVAGNQRRAISDFNKAIEKHSKQMFAYRDRGIAHKDSGQFRKAKADFRKARQLRPGLWVPVF